MKTLPAAALLALLTASVSVATVPSYAQEQNTPAQAAPAEPGTPPAPPSMRNHGMPGHGMRDHGQFPRPHGGPGMSRDLLGFDRGAEAVEVALVRLSHRIELTDAQQPLFDTFKTAALAAAADLETAVTAARPDRAAAPAERPGFGQRLDTMIAIQTARLAALEAIQPSATAFFDSLTPEQTAALTPQRPDHKNGPRHPGPEPRPNNG